MASPDPPLVLHDDRLLPADPSVRAVARRLYDAVRELPIISPHGHVDPRILLDDEPFRDPASLFVTPDHYVTRLLHASGVPLESLGVATGPLPEPEARAVWRQLCSHWPVFRGTPMRYWLDAELGEIFDVPVRPSAATADANYDQIAERLRLPEYRPRSLYERFGISVLATTDDPCSDLSAHAALTADDTWSGRVIPTFRPDRYLCHEGERADTFYLIRHGRVSLEVRAPAGPAVTVDSAHDGDVVGWSWLVPPHRWLFDARATDETSVIAFDGACLRGKCETDPAVGYALLQRVVGVMSDRLHSARVRLLDLYGVGS